MATVCSIAKQLLQQTRHALSFTAKNMGNKTYYKKHTGTWLNVYINKLTHQSTKAHITDSNNLYITLELSVKINSKTFRLNDAKCKSCALVTIPSL